MAIRIVMCSLRRGTPAQAHDLWGDLRVSLWALENYVPRDVPIFVGWDGPAAPDNVPTASNFTYMERPKNVGLAEAMNWLLDQTGTDDFVMIPDDVVLHPDAWSQLMEDLQALQDMPDTNVGVLACRSNYVVGPQNIRSPNGGTLAPNCMSYDNEDVVFPVESVFPVVAWFSYEAYVKSGKFPHELHWFGDNLYSFDLRNLGWSLWVSRAYVHHIGARGTKSGNGVTDQQLAAEGLSWLRKNRPDFYAYLNR